jgi:acetyl-CoA carboxylase biotin carboxyl carrier protein
MADEEQQPMDGEARRTIARLAADTLPRLIERLTNSDLGELEVREDGWRIRLRRPNGEDSAASSSGHGPQGAKAASGARSQHADRAAASRTGSTQRVEAPRGLVSSPAVGYFVPRDGVTVGFKVGRGDPIGHVDVLGVRQEVVAPIDGVIGALEVEAGQAIEFGQPVARVDAPAVTPEPAFTIKVEA